MASIVATTLAVLGTIVGSFGTGLLQDVSELARLSGRWEGEMVSMQAGACKIDDGARSKLRTVLVLDIDSEGNIQAHHEAPVAESTESAPASPALPPWEGKIERSLKVGLQGKQIAFCSGEQRTYDVRYQGKFKKRKNRWELELKGADLPCPEPRCEFMTFYKLRPTRN